MKLDKADFRILDCLQKDASQPLSELARTVGLSTTPCWRRVQRLQDQGLIRARVALLDPELANVRVTVFVSISAKEHSESWFKSFADVVQSIPEIVELHRMSGDIDYLMKIVVPSITAYDRVYKELISKVSLDDVTSRFSMEAIKQTTALPLSYLDNQQTSQPASGKSPS